MTNENKRRLDKWVSEEYGWLRGEISRNIAKGIMSEYVDDLLHHMILDTYKLSDEKITQMLDDNKLRWWMLRGAGLQLRSSTSPFYLIHRRQKMSSRENGLVGSDKNIFEGEYEEYNDDLYECFQQAMENLHWYDKAIMSKYWLEGWNITQIYKYYKISKTHLIKDINRALNEIREACKDCD